MALTKAEVDLNLEFLNRMSFTKDEAIDKIGGTYERFCREQLGQYRYGTLSAHTVPVWEEQTQEDRMQTTIWDVTVYDAETGKVMAHDRVTARTKELVLLSSGEFDAGSRARLADGRYEAIIVPLATVTLREPRAKKDGE